MELLRIDKIDGSTKMAGASKKSETRSENSRWKENVLSVTNKFPYLASISVDFYSFLQSGSWSRRVCSFPRLTCFLSHSTTHPFLCNFQKYIRVYEMKLVTNVDCCRLIFFQVEAMNSFIHFILFFYFYKTSRE